MKKQKRADAQGPSPAGRNELYQTIIDLDKSPESPCSVLSAVFDLLDLSAEQLVAGVSYDDARSRASPKSLWALRWCLTKLSGRSEETEQLKKDVRIWKLVDYLIRILPSKPVTTLLVTHKFANIVTDTISLLSAETQHVRNDRNVDGSERQESGTSSEPLSQILNRQDQSAVSGSSQRDRKRKRDSDQREPSTVALFAVFRSIADVLYLLQTVNETDGGVHTGRPTQLEAVFQLDSKQSSQLLGAAVLTISSLLKFCADRPGPVIWDVQFLDPFIRIWHIAAGSSLLPDIDKQCLPFLTYALGPCLQVIDTIGTRKLRDTETSTITQQLDGLLMRSLIAPWRDIFLNQRQTDKDIASRSKVDQERLNEALAVAFSTVDRQDYEVKQQFAITPVALPHILGLAARCRSRDTLSQKAREDAWLEPFFHSISSLAGIDLRLTKEKAQQIHYSQAQVNVLQALLEEAGKIQLRIPSDALLYTAMHISMLNLASYEDDTAEIHWPLINACLKIDPGLILPSRTENGSVFVEALFKALSQTHESSSRERSSKSGMLTNDNGFMHSEMTCETFVQSVVIPLIDLFSAARAVPKFLEHWRHEVQSGISKKKTSNKLSLIWLDERVLNSLSGKISTEMPTAQLASILEEERRHLIDVSNTAPLINIITIDCLVSKLGHKLDDSMITSQMTKLVEALSETQSLFDNGTIGKDQQWRLWRLLARSFDCLRLESRSQAVIEAANTLSKVCRKTFGSILKDSQATRLERLECLFCLRLLMSLQSYCSESPSCQEQFAKASQSLSKSIHKVVGTSLPRTGGFWPVNPSLVELDNSIILNQICLASIIFAQYDYFQNGDLPIGDIFSDIGKLIKTSVVEDDPGMTSQQWILFRLVTDRKLSENRQLMASIHDALIRIITEQSLERKDRPKSIWFADLLTHFSPESLKAGERRALLKALKDEEGHRKVTEKSHSNFLRESLLHTLEHPDLASYKRKLLPSTKPAVTKTGPSHTTTATILLNPEILDALRALLPLTVDSSPSSHVQLEQITTYLQRLKLPTDEQTEQAKAVLTKLATKMLNGLSTIGDSRSLILTSRAITQLLTRHPWVTLQVHIDELLYLISFHTTARSSNLPADASSFIYTCLSRIVGSILSNHRAKLGGRYHLLVPALQGLLRCLYLTQGRHEAGVSLTAPATQSSLDQPSWILKGRFESSSGSLDDDCATQLSRLLTSLCDPTVSAAQSAAGGWKKGKGSAGSGQAAAAGGALNDPTKKVRSLAGQSLQFVVIEFCRCQLRGILQPALRTQLDPGLYSILSAMSRDVMHSMSAAMTGPERAIFKSLYDDWKQFGGRGES